MSTQCTTRHILWCMITTTAAAAKQNEEDKNAKREKLREKSPLSNPNQIRLHFMNANEKKRLDWPKRWFSDSLNADRVVHKSNIEIVQKSEENRRWKTQMGIMAPMNRKGYTHTVMHATFWVGKQKILGNFVDDKIHCEFFFVLQNLSPTWKDSTVYHSYSPYHWLHFAFSSVFCLQTNFIDWNIKFANPKKQTIFSL